MAVLTREPALLRFAAIGGMNDGKSTLIHRLLQEHQVSPEDLETLGSAGGDVDSGVVGFVTPRRRFLLAGFPGPQGEDLKLPPAAEVALVVVDAGKGILNDTRRQVYLSWLRGTRHLCVAINKMDEVGFQAAPYEAVCKDFYGMAAGLPQCKFTFLPVCASGGDNVVRSSDRLPWYTGPTLLDFLETVEAAPPRRNTSARPENSAVESRSFTATVFWTGSAPLNCDQPYLLRRGARGVFAEVTRLVAALDIGTLQYAQPVGLSRTEIGRVQIETHRPMVCDPGAGSFLLIDPDTNEVAAHGFIEQASPGTNELSVPADHSGLTLWLTGLSSAGKSTLAHRVSHELRSLNCKVEVLDGDVVRQRLCKDLGFEKAARDENIRRIGFVAELLSRNGVIVLVSAISPYRSIREEVRSRIQNFAEVYVNAPVEVCEQRDPKGLYKRARAGEIKGFTAVDDPYEAPLDPEVECRTDLESIDDCAARIISYVVERLNLRASAAAGD